MNISTLAKRIVGLLVAVAATAPMALAGAPASPGNDLGQHATVPSAQCPCNVGLPGGPRVALIRSASVSSTVSGCPCNEGLTGGPRLTLLRTANVSSTVSGCPCNEGLAGGPRLTLLRTANVSSTVSGCPCNEGLIGGPRLALLRTASVSSTVSGCPCNVGLPGGPRAIRHTDFASGTASGTTGSFDWGDAGAGAGFTAGIALLVGGAALVLRRHRVLMRPHS
jgi:hypothetical protein